MNFERVIGRLIAADDKVMGKEFDAQAEQGRVNLLRAVNNKREARLMLNVRNVGGEFDTRSS